jgi:hypothetical protein
VTMKSAICNVRLLVVVFVCALMGAVSFPSSGMGASLLWNPGPKYRAVVTFTRTFSPAAEFGCLASGTTFAEAHLVGNPPGRVTSPLICENMTSVQPGVNGANATYYQTGMVGWTSADYEKYPGWAVWTISGGGGIPIVSQFLNHAKATLDPCTLREVGYSYQNWPYLADSHFKPNPQGGRYTLGEFNAILGKVTAKRTYSAGPPRCQNLPTSVIEIDFRVGYENPDGSVKRNDVLGVLIDVMPGTVDMNGVNDAIFYQSADGSAKILYGTKIGLTNLTSEWKSYSIDFKKLMNQYMTPPSGFTLNDGIIGGYDVYSSVRGGDFDFMAKELDVVGQ